MNEGIPKYEAVNNNHLAAHETLKHEAVAAAKERIADISGYNEMTPAEQVEALNGLFTTLENEGNHNRFIAREVARQRAILEEQQRHQKTMEALAA